MPLAFPSVGILFKSRGADPLVCTLVCAGPPGPACLLEQKHFAVTEGRPGGPAQTREADEGVRPPTYAGVRLWEKDVTLGGFAQCHLLFPVLGFCLNPVGQTPGQTPRADPLVCHRR